jgi:RNA polymerase sigma factor (TIGR02999 family)
MRHEPAGQTLQATALVHEAWLRLGGDQQQPWQNRAHFFGAAAEAMRRILIDRARARQALRRGGDQQRVEAKEDLLPDVATDASDERMLAVDEALARFALIDPQKAELVKLRFYVGMKGEEIAEALGISEPTVKRWWSYARAWLQHEITAGSAGGQKNPPLA